MKFDIYTINNMFRYIIESKKKKCFPEIFTYIIIFYIKHNDIFKIFKINFMLYIYSLYRIANSKIHYYLLQVL